MLNKEGLKWKRMLMNKKKGIMPKVARSLGEKSVSTFCFWWFNQPKIPASMKKIDKN